MIATNGHNYTEEDARWGKYDSAFHAWLVECVEPDEYDGDIDYGGISRWGRRVDYWDSQGFHYLTTFGSEAEATEAVIAWVDEFNAPEVETVDNPRDLQYIVRTHHEPWMTADDGRYTHPSFRGVAVRIYSMGIVGHYYRDGDREYFGDPDHAWVVMVGDDQLHLVERAQLTEISEDDYCPSCGQMGCQWH